MVTRRAKAQAKAKAQAMMAHAAQRQPSTAQPRLKDLLLQEGVRTERLAPTRDQSRRRAPTRTT